MTDRDEICELHSRYVHFIDSHQSEAFADLFATDGSFELGDVRRIEGRAALTQFIDELRESSGGRKQRHFVVNEMIEIDGGVATARSYVTAWSLIDGESPALTALARYDDEFKRENGRWRFARRRVEFDWLASRETSSAAS